MFRGQFNYHQACHMYHIYLLVKLFETTNKNTFIFCVKVVLWLQTQNTLVLHLLRQPLILNIALHRHGQSIAEGFIQKARLTVVVAFFLGGGEMAAQ